jgi:hypothetical protein
MSAFEQDEIAGRGPPSGSDKMFFFDAARVLPAARIFVGADKSPQSEVLDLADAVSSAVL